MTPPVSTSGSEQIVLSGLIETYCVAVPGRVVGDTVLPAAPDHADPRSGEDARVHPLPHEPRRARRHGVGTPRRCPESRVVGQSHGRPAEDVEVRDHTSPRQPVPEPAEGVFDRGAVQQWIIEAHATFNSCADTYTPRRRNAAGACTTASTRAARVLKGNQNRRSDRVSTHGGAPRPSLAARCSVNAARNTSQRSSPVEAGSWSNRPARTSAGSQRCSSRNSATSRHRRVSSDPTSRAPRRATVSGSYLAARFLTPLTLVHTEADPWPAAARNEQPRRPSRSVAAGRFAWKINKVGRQGLEP